MEMKGHYSDVEVEEVHSYGQRVNSCSKELTTFIYQVFRKRIQLNWTEKTQS